MLAINTNSNYFIENQPSVAKELLESLKKLFNDFIGEKIANQRFENLKKDFMFLTNEAHRLNAEIEIIRDLCCDYFSHCKRPSYYIDIFDDAYWIKYYEIA